MKLYSSFFFIRCAGVEYGSENIQQPGIRGAALAKTHPAVLLTPVANQSYLNGS